jgi:2-isopropylmalate synthase
MDKVYILDTTLRDGEQAPGCSMDIAEKMQVATQLVKLGVDIIEAGFPIASVGDFEAVKKIAEEIQGAKISALARAKVADIKRAYEALKDAKQNRIHTFHSTSDIHLKFQYKIDKNEALKRSVEMVKLAKSLISDVEFSPMDATRTDIGYLLEVLIAVVEAGATTINIPDTVGYATPYEYGMLINKIKQNIGDKAIISVHCHNDLGLASANSLVAVLNGARQIECTINGLGERAGNAALEEVVMALKTRKDIFQLENNINTTEIIKTSRLLTKITGLQVQINKAIVGMNAFVHESGIHQDGVLKEKSTYEIMTPESIGLKENNLVMGKHSGRHAFLDKLEKMGYSFDAEKVTALFIKFKDLADKKKTIFDEDIEALIDDETKNKNVEIINLLYFNVTSGNNTIPTATLKVSKKVLKNNEIIDEIFQEASCGDGPIDAVYKAIDKIIGLNIKLEDYTIRAISGGKDAIGEVIVKISCDGKNFANGRGTSTDVVEASLKAYIDAVNKILNKIEQIKIQI